MHKNAPLISGLMAALLSLLALSYLMSSDSHFPIYQWPYQAFQGIVFSLVWGFGVSTTIGYLYALFIVVCVAVLAFACGHKIYRMCRR
ncbi:hypothetical protein [Vibrio mexicanus]|uniref:hypothetical protein n=1 Tax=Vibrio mexicanus TaxID=1004326 RepID=UPI00063C5770|nr:hypothetical protein [Vibrio mexicanus]